MTKNSNKIGIVSGVGPLAGAHVLESAIGHAAQKYGAVEDADYPDNYRLESGPRPGTYRQMLQLELELLVVAKD